MGESLLLDTHALIWWTFDQGKLSASAFEAIEDGANDVFVSAVSAMEIATKVRAGRLDIARPLARGFSVQTEQDGFRPLSITIDHAERAGGLAILHKDPWDRLLLAQAQIEGLTLVTDDAELRRLSVPTLW